MLDGTPLQAVSTPKNWVRRGEGRAGERGAKRLTLTTRPTIGVKEGMEEGVVEGDDPIVSVGEGVGVEEGVLVDEGQLVEEKERVEEEDRERVEVEDND